MSQGVIDDVVDFSTQAGSLGLFGYDKEEGFKAGKVGQLAIDATKEVTGAAAAEEANAIARDQFEKDEARLTKQRADAQSEHRKRQVSLSKGASRARGNSTSTSSTQTSSSINNTQTDFLGL